jgi:hypothetical protein
MGVGEGGDGCGDGGEMIKMVEGREYEGGLFLHLRGGALLWGVGGVGGDGGMNLHLHAFRGLCGRLILSIKRSLSSTPTTNNDSDEHF